MKLKKLYEADLPFLLEVRNHPSTKENLENNQEFTLKECTKWFKTTHPEWFIVINENGDKVGYVRIDGNDVGCDIHPNHRKKGYARKALKLILQNKDYATLWVFGDNFALDFYLSLGFTLDGQSKIIRDRNYLHMTYIKRK